MNSYDKVWVAYNCAKLGNIALGDALIKKETKKIEAEIKTEIENQMQK